MNRRTVTGYSNPTIKFVRSLRDKKHRKRERRFLAEGLRLIGDARAGGRLPELLLLGAGRTHPPLLAEIEADVLAAGGKVLECPPDLLAKITGKDNPQAVAAVFAEWDTSLSAVDRTSAPLWLVAHQLRDPGNCGTMLRTADAVGAGGLILLDDSVDPFSVEAVRASMGAVFTVGLATATWDAFLPWLRAGEGQLIAASLRDAIPYRTTPWQAPCFVMVGNESRGLPEVCEAAADVCVTLPMLGRADSLNAAIAAAVLAYEALAGLDERRGASGGQGA